MSVLRSYLDMPNELVQQHLDSAHLVGKPVWITTTITIREVDGEFQMLFDYLDFSNTRRTATLKVDVEPFNGKWTFSFPDLQPDRVWIIFNRKMEKAA